MIGERSLKMNVVFYCLQILNSFLFSLDALLSVKQNMN